MTEKFTKRYVMSASTSGNTTKEINEHISLGWHVAATQHSGESMIIRLAWTDDSTGLICPLNYNSDK